MLYIAVVGGAECSARTYQIAKETGEKIAERGAILLCGGGSGVMEAASKGTVDNNGVAIGILPGNSKYEGNNYLTLSIATGLGEARNAVIARSADGVIAISGEYGTLSEIALAIKMGKPVVGIETWELKGPSEKIEKLYYAENALEAVEKLWKLM